MLRVEFSFDGRSCSISHNQPCGWCKPSAARWRFCPPCQSSIARLPVCSDACECVHVCLGLVTYCAKCLMGTGICRHSTACNNNKRLQHGK